MSSSAARKLALLVTTACCLVACGDKELEAKRDRLAMEVKRLEAELAVARGRLGEPVPDHTQELAAARKELESTKASILELENEVAALMEERRKVEQEFANYRRNYRIQPTE